MVLFLSLLLYRGNVLVGACKYVHIDPRNDIPTELLDLSGEDYINLSCNLNIIPASCHSKFLTHSGRIAGLWR
jgi:hypothetical protein